MSRQLPEQHWNVPLHVRPHAPQLPTSVIGLMQRPSQHCCPPAHAAPLPHRQVPTVQVSPGPHAGEHGTSVVQVPPMHTAPPVHGLPHIPQFIPSVDVSTHEVPQQVAPAVHAPAAPQRHTESTHVASPVHAGVHGSATHMPLSQICPVPHGCPQPPQFASSLRTSAHIPPQQISLPVHTGPVPHRHSPAAHTLPRPMQFRPHIPQSSNVFVKLTHAPEQHVRPPPHVLSGSHAVTQLPL